MAIEKPTSDDVQRIRDSLQCSMQDARKIAAKNILKQAVALIDTNNSAECNRECFHLIKDIFEYIISERMI